MSRKPTWAKLYWDERTDEPAWSWTTGDEQGVIESDSIYPDDVEGIEEAVEELIRWANLPCRPADWAINPTQDGGWAERTDL